MLRSCLTAYPYCSRAALARLLDFVEGQDGPLLPFDQQHVQCALEVLTSGLLPWVDDLTPQLLVSITCLLAKLQYFDGPLLARLMQVPLGRKLVGYKPWQASGLLWALGRWVIGSRSSYDTDTDSNYVLLIISNMLAKPLTLIFCIFACHSDSTWTFHSMSARSWQTGLYRIFVGSADRGMMIGFPPVRPSFWSSRSTAAPC